MGPIEQPQVVVESPIQGRGPRLDEVKRRLHRTLIDELVATYDRQAGKNCNPVLLLIDEAGRTAIPSLVEP